ncbi:MAG TPA: bifunctional 4-hydroxy-3-methylbut-2-enyl diphosphate reductase/30S ribosomal protein S1 [Firmicutes bacterium]|nr:bifunctional 4-hydroxy-3-methylbut-2-enyl diphosphate reductase/30S ribosomal protein S1 [Bacillota bacterium]
MQVFLAEYAGFCKGVERALELTLNEVAGGKEVNTFGPLVHNQKVADFLAARRVKVVHRPEELEGGAVIIRAHGIGPATLGLLQNDKKIEVVDATCQYVGKVQQMVHLYSQKGYKILIFGDSAHPEVQALLDWSGNRAQIIEPSDIGQIRSKLEGQDLSGNILLLSQTTQRESNFFSLAQEIKDLCPHLEIKNTICHATRLRQEKAQELSSRVDLMLVIGDPRSSNTAKLTQVCLEKTKTYQISGAEDILEEWFAGVQTVGVTAGASTPEWTIKEVLVKMENGNLEAKTEEQSPENTEIRNYRIGDVVNGKIVLVEDEQILVDIGSKAEATLPKGEIFLEEGATLQEKFSPGDSIDLLILKINEQDDNIIVSAKRLERERRWKELEDALENGKNMQGNVKEVVPAGIIINLGSGIEGFMPGSLVDVRYIPDFNKFLGEEFSFKVIELNWERDKVILSRKHTIEEEIEKIKKETIASLEKDSVINGTVKRLTDFGAFVDVGGIDGLVHISEVSWQRVGHPRDVLKVGEEVQVKILDVIPEKEKISLSIRQAQPNPWSLVGENFSVNEIVKGKVTRIVTFGAFVELTPGVEGLVHISQMADFHVKHPSEILQEGEEIEAKILDINLESKRISLSIKEARPAPRDFSSHSSQKDNGADGSVTLGDVFGDLFNKEK